MNVRSKDLLLLAVVWVAMVLIVHPVGDFPINDDWVYAAAVRSLLTTGRFEIYGFSSANLGPQIFWGALFAKVLGFSFFALRLSSLVLGLVGGWAIYLLFDELWKHRFGALVLALAVMVNPVYFSLANTFMTDVPFVALIVGSMLAITAGFRRDRKGLVAAGLALALVAMLLRQFAVVVLLGYAAAHVVRHGSRPRTVVVAVLPLLAGLLLHVLFTKWLVDTGRKPSPAGIPGLPFGLPSDWLWLLRTSLFTILSYIGLFLIPLMVLFVPSVARGRRQRGDLPTVVAVVLLSLLIAAAYVKYDRVAPVAGNVLTWFGIGPLANGDTLVQNLNQPVPSYGVATGWKGVTVLAILSSAGLLVALGRGAWRWAQELRARRRLQGPTGAVLGAFFASGGIGYLAILMLVATSFPLFDRYVLLLMVFGGLALPLLRDGRAPMPSAGPLRVASSASILVVCAVFSVVSTHDYLAWSRVRWNALHELTARGTSPLEIDGGYEFNGWYLYDPKYKEVAHKSWWWVHDDSWQIASGPLAGYDVAQRLPVDRWWRNGAPDVYVLHRRP